MNANLLAHPQPAPRLPAPPAGGPADTGVDDDPEWWAFLALGLRADPLSLAPADRWRRSPVLLTY